MSKKLNRAEAAAQLAAVGLSDSNPWRDMERVGIVVPGKGRGRMCTQQQIDSYISIRSARMAEPPAVDVTPQWLAICEWAERRFRLKMAILKIKKGRGLCQGL